MTVACVLETLWCLNDEEPAAVEREIEVTPGAVDAAGPKVDLLLSRCDINRSLERL